MKKCMLCGENVSVDVVTCPNDGESTWGAHAKRRDEIVSQILVEDAELLARVAKETSVKRAPGRPKKS